MVYMRFAVPRRPLHRRLVPCHRRCCLIPDRKARFPHLLRREPPHHQLQPPRPYGGALRRRHKDMQPQRPHGSLLRERRHRRLI